ncbi:MAG: hypothetical protein OEY33_06160 [Bdellovibrionales bacterium]|nr:hypothetical protein [Bdellovibrionales bacterium]
MKWNELVSKLNKKQWFGTAIVALFVVASYFLFSFSQISQTKIELDLSKTKNKNLEQKIIQLEKEKNLFSAKSEFLEKQLMSHSSERSELYLENKKLKEELIVLKEENEKFSDRFSDFQLTYERLKKENEIAMEEAYSLKFKLENQERFTREVIDEKDRVAKELASEETKSKKLVIKVKDVETKLSEAILNLKELNQKYVNAKQSNLELLSTVELLKADKKTIEGKISYLKNRLDRANQGFEEIGLKKNELSNKNEYLSSQFDILNAEIRRLRLENERLLNNSYSSNYILPVSPPKKKAKVKKPQLAKVRKPIDKKVKEAQSLVVDDSDLSLALNKDFFENKKKAKRLPTSKLDDGIEEKYKTKLAKRINDKLKKVSTDFDTDSSSASVTLPLGRGLFFQKNTAELGPEMKSKLKDVFNVYTKALFSDPEIANTIEKVIVVGHAGPILNGLFVDPKDESHVGYIYNLNLSEKRAENIVQWLKEINDGSVYALEMLIDKIESIGEGVKYPILKDQNKAFLRKKYGKIDAQYYDDPGLIKSPGCGIFSCIQSRRIELRIKFSDDSRKIKKALDKISLPASS